MTALAMAIVHVGVAAVLLLLEFRAVVADPDGARRGGGPVASVIVALLWPLWLALIAIVGVCTFIEWLARRPAGMP